MFTRFVVALSLVSSIIATPLASRRDVSQDLAVREDSTPVSLSGWGGFSSLDGFDNFNGIDNFDGSNSAQVVVVQEQQVVCQTVQVEVIQQQLVILQEFAKKIITQQICEVEVQTIVLQQFSSGIGAFGSDLQRQSGRQVGFDQNISNMISKMLNEDGSLNSSDFGFNGSDVGNNTVVAQGSNWDNSTSPAKVQAALAAAQSAAADKSK
ncbi:hypothetical protein BDZ89DRAFT_426042 [Hymenopellis radicata]|nr:hypothetical protein BDZ89DRAFT_426042 [Hymenopellis radicata]